MKLNIEELKHILLNRSLFEIEKALNNFDLTSFDKHGNNILHYYVKSDASQHAVSKDIIQLFINYGINIDAKQLKSPKRTALELAVRIKSKEVFNILLDRGADVDIPDEGGNVALFHAVMGYRGDDGYFIEKLISVGANVNIANNYQVTPKGLSEIIANYDSKKFFR